VLELRDRSSAPDTVTNLQLSDHNPRASTSMLEKSELRKRAHDGKKKYPTHDAADAAIARCNQLWAPGLESYKCPLGSHWHVGHGCKKKHRPNEHTSDGSSPNGRSARHERQHSSVLKLLSSTLLPTVGPREGE
jgi:hypothetical protein